MGKLATCSCRRGVIRAMAAPTPTFPSAAWRALGLVLELRGEQAELLLFLREQARIVQTPAQPPASWARGPRSGEVGQQRGRQSHRLCR